MAGFRVREGVFLCAFFARTGFFFIPFFACFRRFLGAAFFRAGVFSFADVRRGDVVFFEAFFRLGEAFLFRGLRGFFLVGFFLWAGVFFFVLVVGAGFFLGEAASFFCAGVGASGVGRTSVTGDAATTGVAETVGVAGVSGAESMEDAGACGRGCGGLLKRFANALVRGVSIAIECSSAISDFNTIDRNAFAGATDERIWNLEWGIEEPHIQYSLSHDSQKDPSRSLFVFVWCSLRGLFRRYNGPSSPSCMWRRT